MDLAVTQALAGLLTGTHGNLPMELLELANALLAQSRSQASSLKADEEIARSYVCAHLACRLKRSLTLAKIEPRPPCPPRTYQSLYRHFDNILRAGMKRRGRPPKPRDEEVATSVDRTLDSTSSASTPRQISNPISTERPDQAVSTPLKRAITRNQGSSRPPTVVPSWIMPCIHKLCRTTGASTASSHAYVGTSSALTAFSSILPNTTSGEESLHERARILTLILAIYLCVVFRMSGKPVTGQAFEEKARRALKAVDTSDRVMDNSIDDIIEDVNAWMERFEEKGFLGMGWLQNVPTGSVQEEEVDQMIARPYAELGMRSFRDVGDVEPGKVTLLPGLGTMMQGKVNFLGQAQTADYLEWKNKIIRRIGSLQATT
ncbi:hypothetical protein MMC30_008982 [Trapelia coarctata]|nr:hypothetical protein [Trapelia coarctata]